MTNQQLTPTEELLNQWSYASLGDWREIAAIAAQWGYKQGADEELEACCKWMANVPDFYTGSEIDLRTARRPKPLSLKEQALAVLNVAHHDVLEDNQIAILTRALEALPND
jgi:hypothetical protein